MAGINDWSVFLFYWLAPLIASWRIAWFLLYLVDLAKEVRDEVAQP